MYQISILASLGHKLKEKTCMPENQLSDIIWDVPDRSINEKMTEDSHL